MTTMRVIILLIVSIVGAGCHSTNKARVIRIDVWCDSTKVSRDWNNIWGVGVDSSYIDHRRGTPCDSLRPMKPDTTLTIDGQSEIEK